ncbi:DUF6447 family protein [Prochlorococcus marinus]|uniref:DUF6447 family protein n=1 Tax=Prochlorococcus marinus TaxID=1219 RepID=UPI0022B38EDB|nr:DUF6447 family protein [Prochlorococcus marinus]
MKNFNACMKFPWNSKENEKTEPNSTKDESIEKASTISKKNLSKDTNVEKATVSPFLDLNGKKYNLESLSDDSKKLLEDLKIANQQCIIYEDKLKLLLIARDGIVKKLEVQLENQTPINLI